MPDDPQHNVEISLSDLDQAPVNLEPETSAVAFERYEELLSKFTEVSNDNFRFRTEIEVLTKRVRTSEILDSLIKPYALRTFVFMCVYCAFSGLIIVVNGLHFRGFSEPDRVLELLVGSTAVTVIGLVGMVLTGIFVGARRPNN